MFHGGIPLWRASLPWAEAASFASALAEFLAAALAAFLPRRAPRQLVHRLAGKRNHPFS